MMTAKQMPRVNPPLKMEAALHVLMMANSHSTTPDEWYGTTDFYFDEKRSVAYKSRWRLKTRDGAIARQRRETIQYLKDLRDQIDNVLAKIESVPIDDHNMVSVPSYAYQEGQDDSR